MIDRNILEALVPRTLGGVSEKNFARIIGPQRDKRDPDDFEQRVLFWCKMIQQQLPRIFKEDPAFWNLTSSQIGIGFLTIPDHIDPKEIPRANEGYSFGVFVYGSSPRAPTQPIRPYGIEALGEYFPLFFGNAIFDPHASIKGGKCSAVLTDGQADYFLTVNHSVATVPSGNFVPVQCSVCGFSEKTRLAQRGIIYLDIALLERGSKRCNCSYNLTTTIVRGTQSMTVSLHDGSLGNSTPATIMQGVGPAKSIINGANPQTFTLDVYGRRGDSGCAISANQSLVGSYSGKLSVISAPGSYTAHGFAHCADEALKYFNCNLLEGIF